VYGEGNGRDYRCFCRPKFLGVYIFLKVSVGILNGRSKDAVCEKARIKLRLPQCVQIGLAFGIVIPDESTLFTREISAFGAGGIVFAKGAGADGAFGAKADVTSVFRTTVAFQFFEGLFHVVFGFEVICHLLFHGSVVRLGGDIGIAVGAVYPAG
jgi:hypothetical protein